MANSIWLTEFNGSSGLATVSTAPTTGTWGTPVDALANGGVAEDNGAGEMRPRGSGAVTVYLPTTGYTVPTVSRSYVMHIRAGSGGAHGFGGIVFATASGNFYIVGIGNGGIFIDRYVASAFSSTLLVNSFNIVSGTLYRVQFDLRSTGVLDVYVDGAFYQTVADPSPYSSDGSQEYVLCNNSSATATPGRLSRFEVFDGIQTYAPTVPSQPASLLPFRNQLTRRPLRNTRYGSYPAATVFARSFWGLASGGPPVYDITMATSLALSGAAVIVEDPRITSATALTASGATAVAPVTRVASATSLSLGGGEAIVVGPAAALATSLSLANSAEVRLQARFTVATALQLAGITEVRTGARIASATQLLLAGDIGLVFDIGTPVYIVEHATTLQLANAIGITLVPAIASATAASLAGGSVITASRTIDQATTLQLQGVTGVVTLPRITAAAALSTAQAAAIGMGPALSLATVLTLAGGAVVQLAPSVSLASALSLGGSTAAVIGRRIASATELALAGTIGVGFDIGAPVYVIESATALQLANAIGMTLIPAITQPTSLSLSASSVITRDRAIVAGAVLGLEGATIARSSWRIESATELRFGQQIAVVITLPGDLAWITFATLLAPAVVRHSGRAPAVRTDAHTDRALRWMRGVIPSLDQENP